MRSVLVTAGIGMLCAACSENGERSLDPSAVHQASLSPDSGVGCAAGDEAKTPFAGGSGSDVDPYVICSVEQLNRIRGQYMSLHFVLHANLDASITNPSSPANTGSPWDNGGLGFDPIGNCGPDQTCNTAENINTGDDVSFTGTFDGLNHTISHLYINRPAQVGAALFGKISGGALQLQNLRLEDVNISAKGWVGAAVGHLMANITHSTSSGEVKGTSSYVGGLVGAVGSIRGPSIVNTVTRSSSSATVSSTTAGGLGGLIGDVQWGAQVLECYATGAVSGTVQSGGLVGDMYNGTISDSYASGNVTGTTCVGGLVGNGDFSTLSSVYATGTITGTAQVGGLSGCQGNTALSASFATGTVTGNSKVGGLYGEKWGGTVASSYWYGVTGHPTVMCGFVRPNEPGTGCNDTFVVNGAPSYWYSQQNAPISAWNTGKWTFHADGYPTLSNAASIPTVAAPVDGGTGADASAHRDSGTPGPDGAVHDAGMNDGAAGRPVDGGMDAATGSGGNTSAGGKGNSGGTGAGGTPNAGGTASGGAPTTGGTAGSAAGGKAGSGGTGQGAAQSEDAGLEPPGGHDSSGCDCRAASMPTHERRGVLSLGGLALVALVRIRRGTRRARPPS